MVEQHRSAVERLVHRVEDRIERWPREDAIRSREADERRDALWAEAAERQRLLRETLERESGEGSALAGAAERHRVVYVVASDEFADTLESFTPERERLTAVKPAPGGGGTGLRGLFEARE